MFKTGDIITGTRNSPYFITDNKSRLKIIAIDREYNEIFVKVLDHKNKNKNKLHKGDVYWVDNEFFKKIESKVRRL